MIITSVYEPSFVIEADITGVQDTYRMKATPSYTKYTAGNDIDLWPDRSKTLHFDVPYTLFKGEKWKWEGEEKTGRPPLENFEVSNIFMKYKTKEI
jgi:hypothetical protein